MFSANCNFIMSVYCVVKAMHTILYTATRLEIAIGRKQTRPFAINKVSTDAIIIFLHSESAANHNTCLYGERF